MKCSHADIYMEDATNRTSSFTERFQVREGLPLRSLLPEDRPDAEAVIALTPGACVEGVAGAGGAVLNGTWTLGGWCSFRCELAVPRRFAAREGKRLVAGIPMEDIVHGRIREAMQCLFDDASEQADRANIRVTLSRRLREDVGQTLLSMGWHMTSCRLEDILITRRENT